jgi:hypothetical protein
VLADKNLVPNPRDHLFNVADILRKSGAACKLFLVTKVTKVAQLLLLCNRAAVDQALCLCIQQAEDSSALAGRAANSTSSRVARLFTHATPLDAPLCHMPSNGVPTFNSTDNILRPQFSLLLNSNSHPGATSIAVLPTCTVGPSTQQQQQQQPANAPQLPFPLELLALSMLRVLQRKGHEGQLDVSAAAACRVIVQFASYYRHLSLERLKEMLLGVFPKVVELPVASVGGDKQVRLADCCMYVTRCGLLCAAEQQGCQWPVGR